MSPDASPASASTQPGLLRRFLELARRGDLVALFWEMVRFGWVGLFTLGMYVVEMWLLAHHTHWPAWLNATIAYGPCLVVNYVLHRSFTFRHDGEHLRSGLRYLAVQLGGMGINSGVLWLAVDRLGLPFFPAQVAALLIAAVWSYVGQKAWAFASS